MSVTWTETAAAQLQAIRDYLVRSSPGYAQALAGRIVAQTEALNGRPGAGGSGGEPHCLDQKPALLLLLALLMPQRRPAQRLIAQALSAGRSRGGGCRSR
jgi:hypothetical protein